MSVVCNSFLLTITMKRFTVYLFYVFIEGALSQYHVQENTDEAQHTKYAPEYNNYKPQNYEFEYGISDPHTGDHKSQWEKKEDGIIYGMYSLVEPDGSMRIVEYTADSINGFRAVVKKLPLHDGHQDISQSQQRHGFNTKLPENNHAPYTQSERQEDHSNQQNEKPPVHSEEEGTEYKKDVNEGPINTETEDVETRKNDEAEEDSGYVNYDDENEKYEANEEEEDRYPHSLPYHSAEDEEEND